MNNQALAKLRSWMVLQGFSSFFISRPENFAWVTGGGDNTVVAGESVAWLEITMENVRLYTSCIEERRLVDEEALGVTEVISYPWYKLQKLGHPNDLEYDLTPLRLVLSPEEMECFRSLGHDTARCVGEAVRSAKPDWTEQALAGAIAKETLSLGIQPVVLLVAGETRIFKYRHSLPKGDQLGRLFMAVICGRRKGLVANLTRVCSFGHPEAKELYKKVLKVEAAALNATRPGTTLGEILSVIRKAYTVIGRPEAFEEHHQGGLAGYRPREIVATLEDNTRLETGMAVAWNPSIPGAKIEDTFLLTESGLENITIDPYWPSVSVEGRLRPDLLER